MCNLCILNVIRDDNNLKSALNFYYERTLFTDVVYLLSFPVCAIRSIFSIFSGKLSLHLFACFCIEGIS